MPALLALALVLTATHDAPLELGPTTIAVELTRFEARYTVRTEVRNPGTFADEATIDLAVAPGGAVNGMRYQPRAGAAWLDARVLPTDDAFARWEHYAAAAFAGHRGPALVEMQGDVATLRVLFVPARDRVAVEYTMVAPVCHAAGHWIAPLPAIDPAEDAGAAGARYVVRGPRGAGWRVSGAGVEDDGDGVMFAGQSIDDLCFLTDPTDAWQGAHFAIAAAPAPTARTGVDGRLVIVPAGERHVAEVWVETAAELAPPPRGVHVVFVVDASTSMGDAGVAAQLAIVKAYLARAPGAQFEIVVYRREAAAVFGGWRAGADVDRALADVRAASSAAFAVTNGSNLDTGLARAAELLARAPAPAARGAVGALGPRRLVAFTDDRVREALDEDVVRASLAALPRDVIVHVVGTDANGAEDSELERDDEHWLAAVAGATGGIAAWADIGHDRESAAVRADELEELVRPRRIDDVVIIRGSGEIEELGDMRAGTSDRTVIASDDDAITVRGMIWGTPWQPRLVTSERDQRRVAALALADKELRGLERADRRALATFAHVASDETSLWADDPRWTPGGLPPEVTLDDRATLSAISGIVGTHSSTSSHRHTAMRGRTATVPRRVRPELASLLASPVAACAARATLSHWNVRLDIETTGREIVDVRLLSGADDPAFARCVVESAWSLALGDDFKSWTASFDVNVLGDSARR